MLSGAKEMWHAKEWPERPLSMSSTRGVPKQKVTPCTPPFTARKIVVQLDLDWNQIHKEL